MKSQYIQLYTLTFDSSDTYTDTENGGEKATRIVRNFLN